MIFSQYISDIISQANHEFLFMYEDKEYLLTTNEILVKKVDENRWEAVNIEFIYHPNRIQLGPAVVYGEFVYFVSQSRECIRFNPNTYEFITLDLVNGDIIR